MTSFMNSPQHKQHKQHEQYQHKQHKQVDKGTVLHLTVPLSSGLVDVVCSLPEVSTEPLAGGNT